MWDNTLKVAVRNLTRGLSNSVCKGSKVPCDSVRKKRFTRSKEGTVRFSLGSPTTQGLWDMFWETVSQKESLMASGLVWPSFSSCDLESPFVCVCWAERKTEVRGELKPYSPCWKIFGKNHSTVSQVLVTEESRSLKRRKTCWYKSLIRVTWTDQAGSATQSGHWSPKESSSGGV